MKILVPIALLLSFLVPAQYAKSDELECDYYKTIATSAWALQKSEASKSEIYEKLNIEPGSVEEFLYDFFSDQAIYMESSLSNFTSSPQIYDMYIDVVEDLCQDGSLTDLYESWNGTEEVNEASDTNQPSPSNLPKAGECSHNSSQEKDRLIESISWRGNSAEIKAYLSPKIYEGSITELRKHWEGFRFSAFFEHDALGPVEVVIISDQVEGVPEYRQAAVSYKTTENGERVIGAIQGPIDIDCKVMN